MTFDPNVPNAAQTPGLFPGQNNTNFGRIKTIVNKDHVFNDTAQTTDGVHRQVTMIVHAAATPGDLPAGTNAMLYSWLDANSQAQLRYYNGVGDFQLTPPDQLYPIRVTGAASITTGATAVAYADPGFLWSGTGYSYIHGNNIFYYSSLMRSGSNAVVIITTNTGSISRPTFEFSGNNLLIRNNSNSTQICGWSLIINRLV